MSCDTIKVGDKAVARELHGVVTVLALDGDRAWIKTEGGARSTVVTSSLTFVLDTVTIEITRKDAVEWARTYGDLLVNSFQTRLAKACKKALGA